MKKILLTVFLSSLTLASCGKATNDKITNNSAPEIAEENTNITVIEAPQESSDWEQVISANETETAVVQQIKEEELQLPTE